MIVDDSKYREVYEALKVELRELTDLEKKIPIFVDSNTADSICALRIVTVSSRGCCLPCASTFCSRENVQMFHSMGVSGKRQGGWVVQQKTGAG